MYVGKPSKDSRHPDYAPSIFYRKKTESSSSSSLARFERATNRAKRQKIDDASNQAKKIKPSDLLSDDDSTSEERVSGLQSDIFTECEQLKHRLDHLEKQISQLAERNEELQSENQKLKLQKIALELSLTSIRAELSQINAENSILNQLRDSLESQVKRERFGGESIRDDDAKTCFYTGLPTFTLFITLFNILKSYAQVVPESKGMDEFFAVLVKLRLNLPMKDLAYRLKCSESNFSNIFHKWLHIMHHNLSQLIKWPDGETLRVNLPPSFRKHFSKVKCIIDCFEVFIERPLSFAARAATYSNYKKHNTIKVLIAVSPTGSIVYISNAWGGRVSDKVITQECGFLDHIEYGDVVLADRGFNIADELSIRGAALEIPSFTRGKMQLSQKEVEKSRQLSRVRIHVERVIGQLRKKYKILQGTLPITLIKRPLDTGNIATINSILVVTAALTNLCTSVV